MQKGGPQVDQTSLGDVELTATPSPSPWISAQLVSLEIFQISVPHHIYFLLHSPPSTCPTFRIMDCIAWLLLLTLSWHLPQMSCTAVPFLQSLLMLLRFLLSTQPSFPLHLRLSSFYPAPPSQCFLPAIEQQMVFAVSFSLTLCLYALQNVHIYMLTWFFFLFPIIWNVY